jgi:formylglycine-generating enzyme required for sulfatase activity
MKKGLYVTMIAGIAAALLLCGCEFLLGPDEAVGGGNLTIDFGEGGGRAAAPADLERYDVVLTGPRDRKMTVSLASEETFYERVALGEWHIEAKAYNAGNVLIGTGSTTVTVKVGRNEARVLMRAVPSDESPPEDAPPVDTFIAVTNITGIPTSGTVGVNLTLNGTVSPENATNQAIVWSVKTSGGTGAGINSGNILLTTGAGTVVVTATIANGKVGGTDYTQDFSITINPPPGDQMTSTISGVSVPFRYVPAGSFQRDDTAANVTTITTGYWMGETEVTQELFEAVMGIGTKPSNFTNNPEDGSADGWKKLPVEQVSWYAAIAFCNKLSLLDSKEPVYSVTVSGSEVPWATLAYSAIPPSDDTDWDAATMDTTKNGYRLPTEMEWMWAAMGADTTSQPNTTGYLKAFAGSTGSNSIGDCVWYYVNSNYKTHEGGKKQANELGLYDMSGNVSEWCWDWYATYDSGSQADPRGASSGTYRVLRGGGWNGGATYARSADRNNSTPSYRDNALGFRLARPQF